ncbi:hypothetical protein F383_31817 [Gossypium arboreum]|uniref:Uncharacterized protein n=1 Tax=Gossypium arboreum TaxID=29729 RepID=A0A0B0N1B5_GOSAR|nr:hypothetical protein F383_31817 [Gossypium arboreum]
MNRLLILQSISKPNTHSSNP